MPPELQHGLEDTFARCKFRDTTLLDTLAVTDKGYYQICDWLTCIHSKNIQY